jgi:ribosomal subunit interface protein
VDTVFKSRHTNVQERFRRHATAKLAKLEKLEHRAIRIDVEVSKERNPRQYSSQSSRRERVELTIRSRGPAIRAEASADDRYAALDLALAKLEARLRRAVDRRKARHGVHVAAREPSAASAASAAALAAPVGPGTLGALGAAAVLATSPAGASSGGPGSSRGTPSSATRGSSADAVGVSDGAAGSLDGTTGPSDDMAVPSAGGVVRDGVVRDGAVSDGMVSDGMVSDGMVHDGVVHDGMVPIEMEGDGPLVVRQKSHKSAPITIDQALFEMELVGHDFYLFRDKDSGLPSVVYRRCGYRYGVIRLVESSIPEQTGHLVAGVGS